jgi:uracil-DNA glycosylase family protein
MGETGSTAAGLIPARPTPERLRAAAADCRACELWREGTQTVFGEGPPRARIVAVGEQPGDREDRDGRPFVGPAGRLFDTALERAGIDRADVYVTNAVKHFHHEVRGKRRIHRKPDLEHIRACSPWLDAELGVIHPALAIAMGATAARALLGRPIKVTEVRGTILEPTTGPPVLVTVHPSSILRARDGREPQLDAFVRDLAAAAAAIGRLPLR